MPLGASDQIVDDQLRCPARERFVDEERGAIRGDIEGQRLVRPKLQLAVDVDVDRLWAVRRTKLPGVEASVPEGCHQRAVRLPPDPNAVGFKRHDLAETHAGPIHEPDQGLRFPCRRFGWQGDTGHPGGPPVSDLRSAIPVVDAKRRHAFRLRCQPRHTWRSATPNRGGWGTNLHLDRIARRACFRRSVRRARLKNAVRQQRGQADGGSRYDQPRLGPRSDLPPCQIRGLGAPQAS